MVAVAVCRWRMLVAYVMRIKRRVTIYSSRVDRITYGVPSRVIGDDHFTPRSAPHMYSGRGMYVEQVEELGMIRDGSTIAFHQPSGNL